MPKSKHFLIGLISVVFACGGLGVVTPKDSAAQAVGIIASQDRVKERESVTNKELKDLILMLNEQVANPPNKEPCGVPPTWGGVIPGDERFVPTFVDEDGVAHAYCDRQTGLVWEAEPVDTSFTWLQARIHCINRTVSWNGQKGGRLPAIPELASLVDTTSTLCTGGGPCLPDGHPFSNVSSETYFSASTFEDIPDNAWGVTLSDGNVTIAFKELVGGPLHAWCVRGAMDADAY